jgi:Cd2+/Zn2+-exporting ATPase
MKRNNENSEKACSICATEMFEEKEPLWKRKRITIVALSATLLITGLYFESIIRLHLLAQSMFMVVAALSGYSLAKKGVFTLIQEKRFDMNILMTVAAVGAFLIGHGEEGAAVIFLFHGAEFLEDYTGERAKRSVSSLLRLAPDTATVKRDGVEEGVHVHEIQIGDIIVVRPGDKIPLDGSVVSGISSVNEAPLTGESMFVTKQVGSAVFAGTINSEGFLEIRVTRRSGERMLDKIIGLVEKAQLKKSPTERFIDKFARYYTPSVILLGALVATVPTIVLGWSPNEWVYKSLVLLVISCPCALAISTPISIVSGITSGARIGVLIKGGRYVEDVGKAKVFAFDKTGTLTQGEPVIVDIISFSNPGVDVLSIAASLESKSEHPIARAIVEKGKKENIELTATQGFKSFPGKGVQAEIDGHTYIVGNMKLFEDLEIKNPNVKIDELVEKGRTMILVGNRKEILGAITLTDKIREDALYVVKELQKRGKKTVMLTGDGRKIAEEVASCLGVSDYRSELLPDGKLEAISELKKVGKVVMVGDGVNDAPALAQADVGIAMGAIGSDVALETADIALMHDDLTKIPHLIDLSKNTVRIMQQNIFASILTKAIFAILAFPGIVTLWLAVAIGDMGLSLAVILNAMRLSLVKPKSATAKTA